MATLRARRALLLVSLSVSFIVAFGCSSSDPSSAPAEAQAGSAGAPDQDAAPEAAAEASADQTSEPEAAAPKPLPESVDGDRLNSMLQALSADDMQGRLTGLPSGDKAEQYILTQLKSVGMETQTQEVTFPVYEVLGPAALELVDAADKPQDTFKYIDDFRGVDFSGDGSVTSDLVFVSYGIVKGSVDSYAGTDVTGKIAVVLTGVPSGSGLSADTDGSIDLKIDQAKKHGAAGVIFVLTGADSQQEQQDPDAMEVWALDMYLDLHPELLSAQMPVAFVHTSATKRLTGMTTSELTAKAGMDLGRRAHLEIHGVSHPTAKCRNVFGLMKGSDPALSSENIILGAHYDHVGMGADGRVFHGAGDNGSGTAIVLEAAMSLQKTGQAPKRTLMFAFWCGEEKGLRGSLEYTVYGKPVLPLAKTKLMIQVDYIGETDGPYLTNLDDQPMVQKFIGTSMEDEELPLSGLNWFGQSASDDYGFLYKKVPAYRFLAYGDYHHKSTDTYENLNLAMVKRVADISLRGMEAVGY